MKVKTMVDMELLYQTLFKEGLDQAVRSEPSYLPLTQRTSLLKACPSQCGPHSITDWSSGIKSWPFQPNVGTLRSHICTRAPCGSYQDISAVWLFPPPHPAHSPSFPQLLIPTNTLHRKLQLSICFWRIQPMTKTQLYAVHGDFKCKDRLIKV